MGSFEKTHFEDLFTVMKWENFKKGGLMGEIAEDMVNGRCCSHCGIYFQKAHGYPVLCSDCYNNETKEERAGIQKAIYKES
jgi:hypothetical protein